LVDKRRHSNIPDVRFFSGADCDNDHDVALAKYRERLAVSKRNVKKMDEKKFNLKTLNEWEVKEEYKIKSITGLQLWKWQRIIARKEKRPY
jgi:predicted nucleotidyltransferase